MSTTKRTFVGRGIAYLASYDGSIPYFPVGNASKVTAAITEKALEMPDYQNPGGGEFDVVYLIDSVEIQATLMEYQAANMALSTFGTANSDEGATIASEVLTVPASLGALVPFAHMPDLSVAPVISNVPGLSAAAKAAGGTGYDVDDVLTVSGGTSTIAAQITVDTVDGEGVIQTFHVSRPGAYSVLPGLTGAAVTGGAGTGATFNLTFTGSPVTYTAGTDYIQTRSGIIPLAGGGIIASATLHASYTSADADRIETLTATGKEYKLLFEGLNEADSGKSVLLFVNRIKFSPAKEVALLTDAFGQLDITGKCLKDLTVTTPGLSQYMKILMQK